MDAREVNVSVTVRRVAVVLFDGFTALDAYGPIQAFAACRRELEDGTRLRLFEICTLAMKSGSIASSEGPATRADYTLVDAPAWDVLLIPGGYGTRQLAQNSVFIDWLQQASQRSPITATVCTGSALLARTGLLNGRDATSNKLAWEWAVAQGPKVKWRRRARWIDAGNVVSSSGISAGIDMALALIQRLNGRDLALAAAQTMEYLWNEDPMDDRFA